MVERAPSDSKSTQQLQYDRWVDLNNSAANLVSEKLEGRRVVTPHPWAITVSFGTFGTGAFSAQQVKVILDEPIQAF
jgi:hypothetical protein